MNMLDTIKEEFATGLVKQVYDGFNQNLGHIPNVIKFHSASTTILPYLLGVANEFVDHPTIDPVLVSYLRLIISNEYGGEYCVNYQKFLLKNRNESEENIEQALLDPEKLNIDDKRKSILLFAISIITGSNKDVKNSIENLHSCGWTDKDIYEMCFLGGLQKGMIPLIKAFEVEIDY